MTLDEFRDMLADLDPPAALPPALQAMWHDARGRWDDAHSVAQTINDRSGAWVHAYLHRKEGDDSNAAYWYRRAGEPVARDSFDEEWSRIVRALLA